MKRFFLLALLLLPVAARADEIRHSFFIAGPSFTGIIDEDGKEAWDSGKPAARDGFVLPNGNGVRERAGIVLAWRDERLKAETVEKVRTLRKDSRPWVRQAALHALYHIEKRKLDREEEARQKAEQSTNATD